MATNQPTTDVVVSARIVKEGWARKRSGRMHQWTSRHFTLTEAGVTYKLKPDSNTIRGKFDFVPGSKVTDIMEESMVKMKSNKLYTFWIVNPRAHNDKTAAHDEKADESDEEEGGDPAAPNNHSTSSSALLGTGSPAPSNRNLQRIVCNEKNTQKLQKEAGEEQVDVHASHDNNVASGALVAAVAVGGVVVGALTMGIGLIPYFAVVGITAAAGGGAVAFNTRRRPDSGRLIMAFETNKEAAEWKAVIEAQIRHVTEVRRPMLPDSVDAKTISAILDLGQQAGCAWKRVGVYEGVCVLEYMTFEKRSQGRYKYHPMMNLQDQSPFYSFLQRLVMDPEYMKVCIDQQPDSGSGDSSSNSSSNSNRVRKAQLSVCCSPVDTFLALMGTEHWCWPRRGSFKVVREIDDHADIIGVEIVTDTTKYGGKAAQLRRRVCLSRFWQLDDDGVYLVTYSTIKDDAFPTSVTIDDIGRPNKEPVTLSADCDVQFDAVVTIAPRHDVSHNDTEIPEAMVTCICQVGLSKSNWQKGEVTALMESFVKDNLLELRETLWNNKFGVTHEGVSMFGSAYSPQNDNGFGVDRVESGEINFAGESQHSKLSSPSMKSSKRSQSPAASAVRTNSTGAAASLHPIHSAQTGAHGTPGTASAPSAATTSAGTGERRARGHGVTTVQPGMEEEGNRLLEDTDTTAAPAAAPKKKTFLQRMTSSAAPAPKPAPATTTTGANAATTTSSSAAETHGRSAPAASPTGPLNRKGMQTSDGGERGRSVSPLSAMMRGKNSKTGTGSSEANVDSDFSDTNPLYGRNGNNNRGDVSPPPSSPGSPTFGSSKHYSAANSSKSRDKKTNAEANKLRNHISMTEYEITRLTKSLRKRLASIQALEHAVQAHHEKHKGDKELQMDQQEMLELNSDVQSLHGQIAILTTRQQGLKDEYLRLTGDPFEPSRGTKGMMERWKGARLAQKELKTGVVARDAKEAGAKDNYNNNNNRDSRGIGGLSSPQHTHNNSSYYNTASSSGAGNFGGSALRRSNSNVGLHLGGDGSPAARPFHWSTKNMNALSARSPRQLAAVTQESLLAWLVRMLTSTPQECEAHAQALFAATGGISAPVASAASAAGARACVGVRRANSAAEMAQLDVKAANLVLVIMFTVAMVVVSVLSNAVRM